MYNKTVWQTGDIIPADKMNNIENGIEANDLAITDIKKELVKTVKTSEKGTANGVATLDENGKIPQDQLPELDFIPESEKGQPNGVAPLNKDGVLDIIYGGTKAKTAQEAIYNLSARPNKNLTDNPDFKINQRGKTTAISGEFIADRWLIAADTEFTIQNNNDSEIIANNTGDGNLFLIQKHELSYLEENQIYTLSVLTNKGLFFSNLEVGESNSPTEGLNLAINKNSAIELSIGILTQNAFSIYFVKCEKGENQTLARQLEDGSWELLETPGYATELAKCQRYYWESTFIVGLFVDKTGNQYDVNIQFPTTMRTKPAIILQSIKGTDGIASNWNTEEDMPDTTITALDSYITSEGFNTIVFGKEAPLGNRYAFRIIANAEL